MSRQDKGKGRTRRSRSPSEGEGPRGNFPARNDRREDSRQRHQTDRRDRFDPSRSTLDLLRGLESNLTPERKWVFHGETGLLLHESGCPSCFDYAGHWADAHRTRDPTLLEGIAKSKAVSQRERRDLETRADEYRRDALRARDLEDRVRELQYLNRTMLEENERLVRELSRRDAQPSAMEVDQTPGAGPSHLDQQPALPESEIPMQTPEVSTNETTTSSPNTTKRKIPEESGKSSKRPREDAYVRYESGAVLPIPRGIHGNASLPGGGWRTLLDNSVGTTDRTRVDYASIHRWDSAHNLKLWKEAVAECRSLGYAMGNDQRHLLALNKHAPGLREEARLNPSKTPNNVRWVGDEPNAADLAVWGFIRIVIGKGTLSERHRRRDLLFDTINNTVFWNENNPMEQTSGWTPCPLNAPASSLTTHEIYNHLRARCNVTDSDVIHRLRPYIAQGNLPSTAPERSPLDLGEGPSSSSINSTAPTNARQWGQQSSAKLSPPTQRVGLPAVPPIHIPSNEPATLADSIHAPAMEVDSILQTSRPAVQPYSPTVPEGSVALTESGPPSSIATTTSGFAAFTGGENLPSASTNAEATEASVPEASGYTRRRVAIVNDDGTEGFISEDESLYEYGPNPRFISPGGHSDHSEEEDETKKSKSAKRTDKRNFRMFGAT